MTNAFRRAENRILAKRVKGKFETPVEDVAHVRVLSDKAVSVAGTLYPANTAGYRPGDVIEAVNVKTKGNAEYRARFGSSEGVGNSGLSKAQLQQVKDLIDGGFDNWSANPDNGNTPAPETPTGADPSMTVSPDTSLIASGYVGDDFTSFSQVYTLENTGTASLNWTATSSQSWVTISSGSGTLAAGATTTTTVSINSGASALGRSENIDVVVFNAVNA